MPGMGGGGMPGMGMPGMGMPGMGMGMPGMGMPGNSNGDQWSGKGGDNPPGSWACPTCQNMKCVLPQPLLPLLSRPFGYGALSYFIMRAWGLTTAATSASASASIARHSSFPFPGTP